MKILNLYAGIGGNRKLWGDDHEITAVENNQEIADIYTGFFPNDIMIVTDAHEYLIEHYREFDFIWSSPPCPTHSRMAISGKNRRKTKYPSMKLYEEILMLDQFFNGKYVIENVIPYYDPLIKPQITDRHCFWANFRIGKHDVPKRGDLLASSKEALCEWFGFKNFPNIYLDGNHCERQVLRNCVHPETGQYILDCAMNIIRKSNTKQIELF